MFVQNGTTWTQQQKVIASGADELSRFGTSVAILGDTAIIGRPRGEIATSWNRGSAYVFVRSGTSWIFNERLTASDGQNADAFGSSVAISSDSVIVGAPNVQTQSGAAYVRNRATTPVPPAPPPCETDIAVNISTDLADADLEDDVCDVDAGMSGQQCSLRAAIQTANAKAGPDVILFDIPGGGTHTISPLSLLPPVTEKVSIDATTQPGYSASPLVELRGSGGNYGLAFATGSNDSLVSGFAINRFQAAIAFQSSGNRAEKCYIGLSPAGTAAGMADEQLIGIDIRSATANNNTIGGLGNLRNVISNNSIGVAISQSSTGNKILGNRIGTNTSGTSAIPNVVGVFIESANGNTIGDLITNTNGNLISGNSMLGVLLQTNASNNRVINNSIGTTAGGTGFLPNGEVGILLTAGAHDNRIEKNVIGGHNLTVSSSGIVHGWPT